MGAIDGKHVTIQCPPRSDSECFKYKKTFSIVLQAVLDADGNFMAVDGCGGFRSSLRWGGGGG